MKRYKNLSGSAGVIAYESGKDYIRIRFQDGKTYEYDYIRPGRQHVENMKPLAEEGHGLTTYINQFVRENYARKI